jgi:multidrug efflux system outer membrane protein
MRRITLSLIVPAILGACTLMPHYTRPHSPVPNRWPADTATGTTEAGAAVDHGGTRAPAVRGTEIGWNDFFEDPRLKRLIRIALDNNRNLRVAVLNVEASEAQFRVQRGNLFPAISANGSELAERFPSNGALSLGSSAPASASPITSSTCSGGSGASRARRSSNTSRRPKAGAAPRSAW